MQVVVENNANLSEKLSALLVQHPQATVAHLVMALYRELGTPRALVTLRLPAKTPLDPMLRAEQLTSQTLVFGGGQLYYRTHWKRFITLETAADLSDELAYAPVGSVLTAQVAGDERPCVFFMLGKPPVEPNKALLRLRVTLPDDKLVVMHFSPDKSVRWTKMRITEHYDAFLDMLRLTYTVPGDGGARTVELENDRTLGSYNLQEDTEILCAVLAPAPTEAISQSNEEYATFISVPKTAGFIPVPVNGPTVQPIRFYVVAYVRSLLSLSLLGHPDSVRRSRKARRRRPPSWCIHGRRFAR